MPKQKNDSAPSPAKFEMPEPNTDAAKVMMSKEADDAEHQVAPPACDRVEDLAPAAPGTAGPALPPDDTSEARTAKDETGAEDQVAPPSSGGTEASPEAAATKRIIKVPGIREYVRVGVETRSADYWYPQYSVGAENQSGFQDMVNQADYTQKVQKERVLPHRPESYGTTSELFTRIKQAIAEQTQLSSATSALLTFWIFTTWFQEFLSIAPCLAITGWAHEGDLVLRTLRTFSRNGILVAGLTRANMHRFFCSQTPTLLISEPNLSKRMASFLGCTTGRGHMEERGGYLFDYFCSKAIYLGENLPLKMLQHCVHIDASPTPGVESNYARPLSERMTLKFQNQLLGYRLASMLRVFRSDFNAPGLSPEANAITNSLRKCIVDAPDLQAEIVSLLTPYSEQQIAERLDDLGTLAIGAFLSLCHKGKTQILVGEIALEVNRGLKARGEKLQYTPERVGHKLKKVGLPSRRLGAAGNGFEMDRPTQVLLHEIAAAYGFVGLAGDNENLHCPLCEQNK